MKYRVIFFMVFALFISFLSCSKNDGSRIPEAFVDYRTTVMDFDSRKDENDIVLVNGQGVAGLIICKVGQYSYVAYDRCSSVNPEKRCAVVPDNRFTATDPCSGAMFSLIDGAPAKAPAERNLKRYNVRVSNNFNILVSNDYGN
ncbi:MAG: hypothetical protein ACO1N7_08765 [Sphingobacteriaceae bacterium]